MNCRLGSSEVRDPIKENVQLKRLPKALELFQQLGMRLFLLVARQALFLVGRRRLEKDLAGRFVDEARLSATAAGPEALAGPSQLYQFARTQVGSAVHHGFVAESGEGVGGWVRHLGSFVGRGHVADR